MPFIEAKLTQKLSDARKDELKTAIGACMAVIGKPEAYTMIGIQDGYTLYFAGQRLENGAYVAVDILGANNPHNSAEFTRRICEVLTAQLGIPGNNIYVEYRHTEDWGWNGTNF